ncbi:MAG: hypothetical protein IPJ24_15880 [bacterium]|nr:hypothetical protein [bacterium]
MSMPATCRLREAAGLVVGDPARLVKARRPATDASRRLKPMSQSPAHIVKPKRESESAELAGIAGHADDAATVLK